MRRVLLFAIVVVMCLGFVATAGASPEPPFTQNVECLSCHDLTTGSGAFTKVDFEVTGAVNYGACASCHQRYLVGYQHYHYGYGVCQNCHDDEYEFLIDPDPVNWSPYMGTSYYFPGSPFEGPIGTFATAASPGADAATMHRVHSGSNWVAKPNAADLTWCKRCHAATSCSTCHTGAVGHEPHAAADYPAVPVQWAAVTGVQDTTSLCVNPACHALSAAGTPAFTDPSCPGCHTDKQSVHGYEQADHVADDGSLQGVACSACHTLDLDTTHGGGACGTCHPTPRDTVGAWNQSCVTGGCHTAGSTAPFHANTAAGHAVAAGGAECVACHDGADLTEIHTAADDGAGNTSCLVCHSPGQTPASNECGTCHFAFADHPMPDHTSTWTLASCGGTGCHSTRDLMGVHEEKNPAFGCGGCHASSKPEVAAAIAGGVTACDGCHAGVSENQGHRAVHWADPLLQGASGPNYSYWTGSMGTQPTGDCAGCHVSNLVDEHMGLVDAESGNQLVFPRRDDSGAPLTCDTCHRATDARVLSAIATGQSKCDACHSVHGPINVAHASSYAASPEVACSGCHDSNLVNVHDGGYTVVTPGGTSLTGCDVCHAYFEAPRGPVVQAAISTGNDTKCTACHAGQHPDLGSHAATSPDSVGCGECHGPGGSSVDIKAVHAGATLGACAVCHSNPARVPDVAGKTGECASCHSAVGVDYHRGLPASHIYAGMPATCGSATCHPANALPDAHEPYLARYPEYETTCALCHANTDPGRVPVTATAACDSCHIVHPNPDHVADDSGACVDCHGTADALVLHAGAAAGPCDVCHANPARVPVLPASADCVNCHDYSPIDAKHYPATRHVASDGSEAGLACSACHRLEVWPEHQKESSGPTSCVSCHTAPGFPATWDRECSACHSVRHANKVDDHTSASTSCGGTTCHAIGDVGALHSTATTTVAGVTYTSCGVCHRGPDVVPGSAECATCHQGHGDLGAAHTAASSQECVDCHESGDVRAVHAGSPLGECAVCHDNPARVSVLPSTVECVECHDLSPVDPGHYPVAPHAADDGTAYGYACSACHALGMKPEHVKASSGPVSCVECHEQKVDAFTSAWDGACTTCHDVLHADLAPKHVSATPECAGSTCHATGDVGALHAGASTTVAGVTYTACRVCHRSAASVPTTTTCTGCHDGHGDLSAAHTATNAGDGCVRCHTQRDVRDLHAGSPLGACAVCHDNAARVPVLPSSVECVNCHATEKADYHRQMDARHIGMSSGCAAPGCHANSTSVPAIHSAYVGVGREYSQFVDTCALCHVNPAENPTSASCQSCHLYQSGNPHYKMNHQATSAASQACVECHESNRVEPVHGAYYVTSGTTDRCALCHDDPSRGDFTWTVPDADCEGCHGEYSPPDPGHYPVAPHAADDGTAYGYACSACHALGMKPEHVKASSGPVSCVECHEQKVDAFTSAWDGSCTTCHDVLHADLAPKHVSVTPECAGSTCHATGDVGALHAGASTTVAGVTYTACRVCHRSAASVPTTTTCTGCHDGHGDLSAAHTATASATCVDCHETGDVRAIHAGSAVGACAVCHDNAARVPSLPATVECAGCHDRSPVDTKHYPTTAHLASESGCTGCHLLDMKAEHFKPTVAVTCVECHEVKVDTFTSAWDKRCMTCHPARHSDQALKHVSTNTACSGAGCHNIADASDIHKGVQGGGCSVCHTSATNPATTTNCTSTGCHAGATGDHHVSHDGQAANGVGCEGCHFRYLDDEHAALGYTCATCHSSTSTVVKNAIAANDRRCLTCHPDSAHNARQASEFAPGNASMHRVRADLPGMRSSFVVNGSTYTWSLPSASSFLKSGYAVDTMVTCSSCHTYSGTTGPHGATMKVNMDPAYPNPFRVTTGSESYTAQLSNSSSTGMSMTKNGGSPAGIICEKCHDLLVGSSFSNVAHKEHDDRGNEGAYCNHCHVAVPHGWGRPRLLGYTSDPAAYRTYANGGLARISIKNYTPSGWSRSDCGAGCSSSRHPLSGSSWPNQMAALPSQAGTLSGKVTDVATLANISAATVSLSNGASTSSASDGTYTFTGVTAGTYTMTVSKTGYTTWSGSVTITAGATTTKNVALTASTSATNWARTGTATASSTDGSYSPSRAIDGSTSTYWRSSSGGTQWLRVDLGSSKSVSKVVVNWSSSYYARAYRIETSADGTTWTSRYSTSSGTSGTKTHTFTAVSARYVRVYCTSANYSNYRINEFEVWNF